MDRMQELWITGRRTWAGRCVATGFWDWQLCPDLGEGPYASVLVDCRLVRWKSSWGRSCPVQPLPTLPVKSGLQEEGLPWWQLHLERVRRNWMPKAQQSDWDPELCSQAQFKSCFFSADTSVNLEQMIKVPLLCLISSSVKPQQDYLVIHIIGSSYHKNGWDD